MDDVDGRRRARFKADVLVTACSSLPVSVSGLALEEAHGNTIIPLGERVRQSLFRWTGNRTGNLLAEPTQTRPHKRRSQHMGCRKPAPCGDERLNFVLQTTSETTSKPHNPPRFHHVFAAINRAFNSQKPEEITQRTK
jgi:hypothetical protein